MSHHHTSKTIPAPGLEEMLAALGKDESGHPGEGWFSVRELADTSGLSDKPVKERCDKLVQLGTYESCRRKIGSNITTFYRLKGSASVQQRQTMKRPVRSSPPTLIPPSRGKRAGKR